MLNEMNLNLSDKEIIGLIANGILKGLADNCTDKENLSVDKKPANFYDYELTGKETYFREGNRLTVDWSDKTRTYTELHTGDKEDTELALLICFAKKFVRGLDLDKLYSVVKAEDIKVVLKQMLTATAGSFAIALVKDWTEIEINDKLEEELEKRQEAKRLERRKKRFEKIEQLKKSGKWVSVNDLQKLEYENEMLRARLEKKNEKTLADKFREAQAENKRLQDELSK